jgi:hypothetical protein
MKLLRKFDITQGRFGSHTNEILDDEVDYGSFDIDGNPNVEYIRE